MKNSRELLRLAGILPKLRLGIKKGGGGIVSTGPHRVKFIEDKIIKKPDDRGKEVEWVRYIVEENGVKKYYDTKLKDKNGQLSYLVQRLADIEEGTEVILEMKKLNLKNYIEVSFAGGTIIEADDDNDFDDLNEKEID
jgi:hypothetical protein